MNGPLTMIWSSSQKEDKSLSATWNGQALGNVKFENNKLTFTRRLEFGDNEMVSNFTGKRVVKTPETKPQAAPSSAGGA